MSDSRQLVPGHENYPVLVNQPRPTDLNYLTGRMLGLSIIQMICGVLSIAFGVASLSLPDFADYGSGIWCGAVYIVTGSLGIPAARHKIKGFIITYMIMSIISAALCLIPGVTYTYNMGTQVGNDEEWKYIYVTYPYGGGYNYSIRTIVPNPAKYSVFAVLVFVSIVEGIAAIISSVCCCRAVCGCKNSTGAQQTDCYYPQDRQIMPSVPNQPATVSCVEGKMPVYNVPVNNMSIVAETTIQNTDQPPSYEDNKP